MLLYAGISLAATWPLAAQSLDKLPVGNSPVAVVPLLNTWTIWWNADRAWNLYQGYWTAPIFHPHAQTFAFSEPQPLSIIVAPVIWITGSRVLAYNVYLWGNLLLNGLVARHMLLRAGVSRLLALPGGGAVILLPIVHWQRDVLQLVPVWGILWTWEAAWRHSQSPSLRQGLRLGVAATLTAFSCLHHFVFLSLLLSLTAFWQLVVRGFIAKNAASSSKIALWNFVLGWLVASGCVAAGVGPMVYRVVMAAKTHAIERDLDLVGRLSARPAGYLRPWGNEIFQSGRENSDQNSWRLSPGRLKTTLAVYGLLLTLGIRFRRSGWVIFLAWMAVAAFLLSLGTHLQIAGWSPWETIRQIVPGASAIRNLFRFAYFYQLAVALLAFYALHLTDLYLKRTRLPRRLKSALLAGLVVLAWLTAFEVTPPSPMLATVPNVARHRNWIEYVQREAKPGAAILMLPASPGSLLIDFEGTAQAMYLGTFHGVPLMNGYSGMFPRDDYELRQSLQGEFPTQSILRTLHDKGVRFVVVLHDLDRQGRFRQHFSPGDARFQLSIGLDQPGVATVYELRADFQNP